MHICTTIYLGGKHYPSTNLPCRSIFTSYRSAKIAYALASTSIVGDGVGSTSETVTKSYYLPSHWTLLNVSPLDSPKCVQAISKNRNFILWQRHNSRWILWWEKAIQRIIIYYNATISSQKGPSREISSNFKSL